MFAKFNSIFTVAFEGNFEQQQVKTIWNPQKSQFSDSVQAKMDEHWDFEISKNKHLFNGDLCGLADWKIEQDNLILNLGCTNYQELLYSNHQIQAGEEDFISDALGVSAVLLSSDDQIILIERSRIVGEFPGKLDVVGGHIHPTEHAVSGTPDPFLAIQAEIEEEVNPDFSEYSSACIGLIETVATKKPELIFLANSSLSAREILELGMKNNSPEISKFLTASSDDLTSFLETRVDDFSPSAFGALCLYAQFNQTQ